MSTLSTLYPIPNMLLSYSTNLATATLVESPKCGVKVSKLPPGSPSLSDKREERGFFQRLPSGSIAHDFPQVCVYESQSPWALPISSFHPRAHRRSLLQPREIAHILPLHVLNLALLDPRLPIPLSSLFSSLPPGAAPSLFFFSSSAIWMSNCFKSTAKRRRDHLKRLVFHCPCGTLFSHDNQTGRGWRAGNEERKRGEGGGGEVEGWKRVGVR